MESEISYDPVEKLIREMKELNFFLVKKLAEMQNEKQCKNLLQDNY